MASRIPSALRARIVKAYDLGDTSTYSLVDRFQLRRHHTRDLSKTLLASVAVSSLAGLCSPAKALAESSAATSDAGQFGDVFNTVALGAFGSFLGVVGTLALAKAADDAQMYEGRREVKKRSRLVTKNPSLVTQIFISAKDAAPVLTSLIAIGGIAAGGFTKLSAIEKKVSSSESKFAETNRRIEEENQNIRALTQQTFELALRQAIGEAKVKESKPLPSPEAPQPAAPSADPKKP